MAEPNERVSGTRRLRVFHISPEARPLFSTGGGPSQVAAKVPQALASLDISAKVILPGHLSILQAFHATPVAAHLPGTPIIIDGKSTVPQYLRVSIEDGTTAFLVGGGDYFKRERPYGQPDDLERFAFFSLGTLDLLRKIGGKAAPDF